MSDDRLERASREVAEIEVARRHGRIEFPTDTEERWASSAAALKKAKELREDAEKLELMAEKTLAPVHKAEDAYRKRIESWWYWMVLTSDERAEQTIRHSDPHSFHLFRVAFPEQARKKYYGTIIWREGGGDIR